MRILPFIAAAAVAAPACAATLVPVPAVPGSTQTFISSINDHNQIAGYYFKADGTELSFFGGLDGQYTRFDADPVNAPGSSARGISNDGTVIGVANQNTSNQIDDVIYERKPNGAFKFIAPQDQSSALFAGGISRNDVFTVENFHSDSSAESFLGRNGRIKSKIDFGVPVQRIRARGLTDSTVSGYYREDSAHHYHGFLYGDAGLISIDYPDETAAATLLKGVNKSGVAAGYWEDANFVDTAFLYNSKKQRFKQLHVPDYPNTAAAGINSKGLVALLAYTAEGQYASLVYCPGKPSKCPAGGTEIADGKWIAAKPGFKPRGPGVEPVER